MSENKQLTSYMFKTSYLPQRQERLNYLYIVLKEKVKKAKHKTKQFH